LVIGGYGGGNTVEILTTDKICNGQNSVPKVPLAPSGQLVGWRSEYVDGLLYLCGGQDINDHAECYKLKLGDQNWTPAQGMMDAREYHTSTVFNGQMMVFGGFNDRKGWLTGVELKGAGANGEWAKVANLGQGTYDLCAVQMDADHVIVIGGNTYESPEVANVDILNVASGTWEAAEPLPSIRAAHACVATEYNGEKGVMVTGGCVDRCHDHLTDVLFFGFNSKTWVELPPMNMARYRHGLAIIGGYVTAIAGYDQALLGSLEYFDGSQWIMPENVQLEFKRYAFGMPTYLTENEIDC